MIDLAHARRDEALRAFERKCVADMAMRWPAIDFHSLTWPLKSQYQTKLLDVRFEACVDAFDGKSSCYLLALRCLVASAALRGKTATWRPIVQAWRLLTHREAPLAMIRRADLSKLEEDCLSRATPTSAARVLGNLKALGRLLDDLAKEGVVELLHWTPSPRCRSEMHKMHLERQQTFKVEKAEVLDRQIEALSEATAAMLAGDQRLDAVDLSAIAAINIMMCAPSRINEPLSLKVGDRFTIEDYAKRSDLEIASELHGAHKLLMMKGSKGAAWSPKPILNFMVALSDKCWDVLLEQGQRSRALLTWYEEHPDELYLIPELEHLRGKPLTPESLWLITNSLAEVPADFPLRNVRGRTTWASIVKSMGAQQILVENPRALKVDGRTNTEHSKLEAFPWHVVETYLLRRVRERMESMRNISPGIRFEGRLSDMLMLVDVASKNFYLPQNWDAYSIRYRFKTTPAFIKSGRAPSVFVKLGLRMAQGAREVDCYLEPHDTRRWLTTQALAARERLSDVLINKWANRLSIGQLSNYDLRTSEQRAKQASMPMPNELVDLSNGLKAIEHIESSYGLSTDIVVAHGEGVSVTSMEAVCQASSQRPVARTSNQIIILYPTAFGVCLHQHHETPCRSYECVGCNEQVAVKGHLPTNQEWRKQSELSNRGIINQLQALVTARNRGIADDPEMLDLHLLTLVRHGLEPEAMATDLIDRFHEIKGHIRDLHFRNELEKAFVARGIVLRLDDDDVGSGAVIKYHNPSRHAAPGHERAVDSQFGGRVEMDRTLDAFYLKHPAFAPSRLGLQDQRHLIADADDSGDEGAADEQAA